MRLSGNAGEAAALLLPNYCRLLPRRRLIYQVQVQCEELLSACYPPQAPDGETLGGPLLSLGAVALVHSHGFLSAETKIFKVFFHRCHRSLLYREDYEVGDLSGSF